jgi:S1-C subfamily serine protease
MRHRLRCRALPLAVLLAALFASVTQAQSPLAQEPSAPATPPAVTPSPQPAQPQAAPQAPSIQELLSGVVRIKTFINPDGRTVENLGREREGSGVVIDGNGLVVTIGYLMVEAHAAEIVTNDGRTVPANIVGYDHETGFGILQAIAPLKVRPMAFGKSSELKQGEIVIVAGGGGADHASPVAIASKREFAGSWEYLLDEAIFTAPPHPAWSGAALISREGKLLGVGSLIVGDATGDGSATPGNMFVPIDRLPPILADLMSDGRVANAAPPWLGLTTEELRGRLIVSKVIPGGPAEKAGLARGTVIVGVAGQETNRLADFYRKVRSLGRAGVNVPLDVMQNSESRHVDIKSMNRLDHLKLKSTF